MFYLLRTDREPALSPEHTEFAWVKPQDIEALVTNDVPTKETLYEDIPLLVEHLDRTK